MSEATQRPGGSIYDLGYRGYEGQRLGRRYAVQSLFFYSLRSIFGIGRGWLSKAFPIGLAGVAMVPALIQVAIAAIVPLEFEFIAPEDYFGFVSVILALFCAVAAPEIIGRDQRTRTLSLYFSRAMSRVDYAVAKLAALLLSLWVVLLAPMVLLLVGDAVAADDLVENVKSNIDLVPPIVATSLVIATVMGSMSVAISSMTSRRAYSTGSVLAYFVVFTTVGETLLATLSGESKGYALLISPVGVLEGTVYWIFNTPPPSGEHIEEANLAGVTYFIAACAYASAAIGWYLRRIQKMAV